MSSVYFIFIIWPWVSQTDRKAKIIYWFIYWFIPWTFTYTAQNRTKSVLGREYVIRHGRKGTPWGTAWVGQSGAMTSSLREAAYNDPLLFCTAKSHSLSTSAAGSGPCCSLISTFLWHVKNHPVCTGQEGPNFGLMSQWNILSSLSK